MPNRHYQSSPSVLARIDRMFRVPLRILIDKDFAALVGAWREMNPEQRDALTREAEEMAYCHRQSVARRKHLARLEKTYTMYRCPKSGVAMPKPCDACECPNCPDKIGAEV